MGDRNTDVPTFLKYISFLYYLDRSETEPVTATDNNSASMENFFLLLVLAFHHPLGALSQLIKSYQLSGPIFAGKFFCAARR
jgi:hypothetical protein